MHRDSPLQVESKPFPFSELLWMCVCPAGTTALQSLLRTGTSPRSQPPKYWALLSLLCASRVTDCSSPSHSALGSPSCTSLLMYYTAPHLVTVSIHALPPYKKHNQALISYWEFRSAELHKEFLERELPSAQQKAG